MEKVVFAKVNSDMVMASWKVGLGRLSSGW